MRTLMVLAAVALLAGCGSDIEEAHKAVAAALPNPGSAKFTTPRVLDHGNVCGQVRSKDASGSYTGYQRFVAIKAEDGYHAIIDPDGTNQAVSTICGGAPVVAAAGSSANGWEVQIASNAMGALSDMTSRLVEHGFMATVVKRDGQNVVYLGPFDTQAAAEAKKAELMASQGIEANVVPHPAE